MDNKKEAKIITNVTIMAIVFNIVLLAVKIVFGILGESGAIINGAIDSGLDILVTSTILIVGRYSRKKADKNHPYGHEKFESIVAILMGILMIVAAVQLIVSGIELIIAFSKDASAIVKPNYFALIAAGLTIVIKLGLFIVTRRWYRKAHSPALKALSVDHISDVLVAIVLIVGVTLAMSGVLIFEPIAGLFVALFIGYNGFSIIKESIGQVVDEAADKETVAAIRKLAKSIDGVSNVDLVKTRMFGYKMYVDIEISVDGNLSVNEGHIIAENVHDAIEEQFESVKHCMVHVNPDKHEHNKEELKELI